jgi:hypothetical protein
MAGKTLWVKNNGNSNLRVRANKVVKGSDEPVVVLIEFPREKTNRITGSVEESGYTSVSKEDYKALYEGSKIFKSFVDNGTIASFEDAPEDAFVGEQRIANLQGKVAELEAANTDATSKIAELEEALNASNTQLKEITNIKGALEEEFETYKKQFPVKAE